MAKKMLIDATHAEETRVVVVDGNKVEEFDFESQAKRQLAGNIYLAKITRVEPSLQAAFVEYGGNRHGFLAFAEIHPDYYQIPVADREALLAEEEAYAEQQRADEEAADEATKKPRRRSRTKKADAAPQDGPEASGEAADASEEAPTEDAIAAQAVADVAAATGADAPDGDAPAADDGDAPETEATDADDGTEPPQSSGTMAEATGTEDAVTTQTPEDGPSEAATDDDRSADVPGMETIDTGSPAQPMGLIDPAEDAETASGPADDAADAEAADADADADTDEVEAVPSDEDEVQEVRRVRKPKPRRYKIQEVVKVRQIMLVQVVKEERGNKGAALTTYLSLAGRYCVLMPNTARGGGISRKITNAADRKKLKEIATSIEVPKGAGLIVRTAGAKRTKTEIKRDYEYLQRMWEQIRELTLKSVAPAAIYEEGNLIKRSIRDLYNREIDEVWVEGGEGYRTAKDFMKMIMPSHAKNVKNYHDAMPL
ncbi:MAG: ribonuclease E/G, partial [Shimia sp.]